MAAQKELLTYNYFYIDDEDDTTDDSRVNVWSADDHMFEHIYAIVGDANKEERVRTKVPTSKFFFTNYLFPIADDNSDIGLVQAQRPCHCISGEVASESCIIHHRLLQSHG